jgi:hypothetical protein
LALLVIKHGIADLWLQSFHTKSYKINWLGGHRHYLEHSVLTLLIASWFLPLQYAVVACLLDYCCHWHVDWAKHHLLKRTQWTFETAPKFFFFVQSIDQILHYLTYWLIVILPYQFFF